VRCSFIRRRFARLEEGRGVWMDGILGLTRFGSCLIVTFIFRLLDLEGVLPSLFPVVVPNVERFALKDGGSG
jgi:hypothetical protein